MQDGCLRVPRKFSRLLGEQNALLVERMAVRFQCPVLSFVNVCPFCFPLRGVSRCRLPLLHGRFVALPRYTGLLLVVRSEQY